MINSGSKFFFFRDGQISVGNYSDVEPSLRSACNSHCLCSEAEFRPVCAEFVDGRQLSYYSPCYAGCLEPYTPMQKVCSCRSTWQSLYFIQVTLPSFWIMHHLSFRCTRTVPVWWKHHVSKCVRSRRACVSQNAKASLVSSLSSPRCLCAPLPLVCQSYR